MKRLLLVIAFACAAHVITCAAHARTCGAHALTCGAHVQMFTDEVIDEVARAVVNDTTPQRSYRPLWNTAGWLVVATVYDVETTFWLMDRCATCEEQNPVTKSIVEKGRFATYAYSLALDAVILYIAKRMVDRGDSWWRVLPVTLAIVHGVAGTWNLYRSTKPPS